jgi:murein L,D-transpeptidase YcbB/YkuD
MKSFKPKLFFALVFCISCNSNSGQNSHPRKDSTVASSSINSVAGNFSTQQTIKFDPEKITAFFIKYPQLNEVKKGIDSFYHNRQYACAWFDEKGMMEQAGNLYNHIVNLDTEGVKDKLPYQKEFATMMVDENKDSLDVNTEIMLTAQYFVYAKQAWTGLNEKQTQSLDWYLPRKKIEYNLLLDSFILGKDVLNSPPIYRQYYLLKNQLKKYREINTAGGFPVIADIKKSLKKGDSSSIIIDIQKWLIISGDLNAGIAGPIFNDSLEAAVERFQQRFGLKVDAVIGAAFIKEMNVPAETRMQEIMVNMERSRWVPVTVSTDYLVLNIPEFKLHAYEHDSLLWSMDAVVGKPVHKTVIFSGKIKYIVFSPYWNVPNSILQHEVLPAIRRNKNYLANQHMEWNGGQVRQKSGPDNALGLVKFLFPNSYNIYLHDTPAKSLFIESSRAFSHGCIRLSNAEELANYLLKNDTAWTAQKINTAMHLGREKFVTVQKSETVFIVYFTAWVDSAGKLNFRKDLYGRDKRLAAMLLQNPVL